MTYLDNRDKFNEDVKEMFDLRIERRKERGSAYDFQSLLRQQYGSFGKDAGSISGYTQLLWDELFEIKRRFIPGWGSSIDIGVGWYHIIAEINTLLKLIDPEYNLNQVKEKFGTLRYYYELTDYEGNPLTPLATPVVAYGESRSGSTCDICGEAGSLDRSSSWLVTRCKECAGVVN